MIGMKECTQQLHLIEATEAFLAVYDQILHKSSQTKSCRKHNYFRTTDARHVLITAIHSSELLKLPICCCSFANWSSGPTLALADMCLQRLSCAILVVSV